MAPCSFPVPQRAVSSPQILTFKAFQYLLGYLIDTIPKGANNAHHEGSSEAAGCRVLLLARSVENS